MKKILLVHTVVVSTRLFFHLSDLVVVVPFFQLFSPFFLHTHTHTHTHTHRHGASAPRCHGHDDRQAEAAHADETLWRLERCC